MTIPLDKKKKLKNFLKKASGLFVHQSLISIILETKSMTEGIEPGSDTKKAGKKCQKK
jgi:hypothetical protein